MAHLCKRSNKAQEIVIDIEAKPIFAVLKLIRSPLDGVVLGKEEALRLANEANDAFIEMGMKFDERKITQWLEMFANGQFPK